MLSSKICCQKNAMTVGDQVRPPAPEPYTRHPTLPAFLIVTHIIQTCTVYIHCQDRQPTVFMYIYRNPKPETLNPTPKTSTPYMEDWSKGSPWTVGDQVLIGNELPFTTFWQ
jgi:hypothetical protein